VVQSIARVTSIVSEISEASLAQSANVNSIRAAIGSIDDATQQNAALVEEGTAAAHSLKHQADELVSAVSVFRV
jgi:methyl-accepting chemotaxis protein